MATSEPQSSEMVHVFFLFVALLAFALWSFSKDSKDDDSPKSGVETSPVKSSSFSSSLSLGCPPGRGSLSQTRRDEIIRKFQIPHECLNSGHDYSYSSGCSERYGRGGEEYFPPWNFDKLGVLIAKYEDSSFLDAQSGWHVAYHGTDPSVVPDIVRGGLKAKGGKLLPKHGNKHGDGIYCSPCTAFARTYAGEKRIDDRETDVVLMARVRPGSYTKHGPGNNIWLVKNENDIRCTAILFFRR